MLLYYGLLKRVNKKKKILKLQVELLITVNDVDSTHDLAVAYDEVNDAVVERRLAPVYGKNFPLGDKDFGVKSALERVPYNTDPAVNDCLAKCPDINVPTFYLARQGSFTRIHQKDGFLDACNFVHWGDPNAKYHKLWLLVHPNDTWRCISAMREDVAKLFRVNGHLLEHVGTMDCSAPHFHKNLVVTEGWLKQRYIKFEIIDQRPGDLIYLAPTILYQVVNFSKFCRAVQRWKSNKESNR